MAVLISPLPRIFSRPFFLVRPRAASFSSVNSVSWRLARLSRLSTLYSVRKMLVNPRLGRRRCRGIWPPSKPRIRLEPVRDPWPLWPRVEVLPMPDPIPRPTRLRPVFAFLGARRLDRFFAIVFLAHAPDISYRPTRVLVP